MPHPDGPGPALSTLEAAGMRSCRRRSKSCVVVSMLRPSAAATASTLRLVEASPSCPLIAFNRCMVLGPTSPPEHPPPPRPLSALLRLYRSGVGLSASSAADMPESVSRYSPCAARLGLG